MSGAVASIAPRRLRRLVHEAYVEHSAAALAELRAWATTHRDEAKRAAARDGHLRALLEKFSDR